MPSPTFEEDIDFGEPDAEPMSSEAEEDATMTGPVQDSGNQLDRMVRVGMDDTNQSALNSPQPSPRNSPFTLSTGSSSPNYTSSPTHHCPSGGGGQAHLCA
eukprot:2797801-Amphidinium_carterae.2